MPIKHPDVGGQRPDAPPYCHTHRMYYGGDECWKCRAEEPSAFSNSIEKIAALGNVEKIAALVTAGRVRLASAGRPDGLHVAQPINEDDDPLCVPCLARDDYSAIEIGDQSCPTCHEWPWIYPHTNVADEVDRVNARPFDKSLYKAPSRSLAEEYPECEVCKWPPPEGWVRTDNRICVACNRPIYEPPQQLGPAPRGALTCHGCGARVAATDKTCPACGGAPFPSAHQQHDPINHPNHYTAGGIEVIDFIEAWNLDFHRGNVVKYVARAEHKGKPLEDLKKARWYLDRAIERLQGE